MAAVLAGDRDAFRVLVEREAPAILQVCHRILGDVHEAEDAAQETFVTAFRALSTWRGEGPFGAWLARIAVRISLRQVGRRRTVAWIDPTNPETPGQERGTGLSDGARQADGAKLAARAVAMAAAHDPAAIAVRAERAASVRAAVARLDEPYREVVALRFFAELSLAEIAVETGRPLGTVKTHLHRGLLRMRSLLASEALP